MITKRSVTAVGFSAAALLGVTLPAGATALEAQKAGPAAVEVLATESLAAQDTSDSTLLSASGAFLALGIGTVTIVHRRRWSDSDR